MWVCKFPVAKNDKVENIKVLKLFLKERSLSATKKLLAKENI